MSKQCLCERTEDVITIHHKDCVQHPSHPDYDEDITLPFHNKKAMLDALDFCSSKEKKDES